MKRIVRILLIAFLGLLPACSSGGKSQGRAQPTRTPKAARSAGQSSKNVPGRLLYVADQQIWLHQGASAEALPLEGALRDPAWSPDGQRIAYVRRDESFSDLYIYSLESSRATQVTSNDSKLQKRTQDYVHSLFWAAKPTWSPDGQDLLFLSQRNTATQEGQQPALYEYPLTLFRFKMRLVGTREPNNNDVLHVGQQDSDVLSPTWSPRGGQLAFVLASRDEKPRRIMRYDFQNEQAQPFPGVPDGAYDPAWSPDGSKLAFAISQDGATDIWVTDTGTGGVPARVTKLGRARTPVWSPDGSMIAFVNVGDSGSDLYTVTLKQDNGRLTVSEPEQITDGEQIDPTAGMSWAR